MDSNSQRLQQDMQSSTLQLFDVNQTTLIQWHNKQLKRQECNILLQGVNLPASIPVAPVPLPPVQVPPIAAPPQPGPQHQYHLPWSTVGQAVAKRKSAAPAQCTDSLQSVCPRLPARRQLFPQQTTPPTPAPLPTVFSPSPASNPLVYVFSTPQAYATKRITPAGPLSSPPPARRTCNRKWLHINWFFVHNTYTVPKMLVFHLTSGWRRCGGWGQIRNKLFNIHPT